MVEAGPVIVVFDPLPARRWTYDVEDALVAAAGARLVVPRDAASSREAIVDADIVVVTGAGRLSGEAIGTMQRAVGILCSSVGTDQVDRHAAAGAGIEIRNIPDYCTDEVADHALTLLLAAWRHLVPIASRATAGDWSTSVEPDVAAIRRIRGRTLGIIGAGRVGRAVGLRARAFGMLTVAADPFVSSDDPLLPIVRLEELMRTADAIVLCAALTSGARGLVDDTALADVRHGLVVVNVARGGLIDEAALAAALRDGRVGAAALDVRDPEPPIAATDPLAGLGGFLATPHMAATSLEAVDDLHRRSAEIALELLRDAERLPPDEGALK